LAVETLARGKFGPLEWWSGGGWQTGSVGTPADPTRGRDRDERAARSKRDWFS